MTTPRAEQPVPPVSAPASDHATPSTFHEYSRRFVSNVLFGYIGRVVQWLVSLFLLAYVIRSLGPDRYSLIIIATSTVTFISLVQVGASTGIAKQLNKLQTLREMDRYAQYYTAAVMLSFGLALMMLVGVVLAITALSFLFKFPAALLLEGHLVIIAIGGSAILACLRLPSQAVQESMHRIDIIEKLNIAGLAIRVSGVLLVFHLFGPSPLWYALVLMTETALSLFGSYVITLNYVPHARMCLKATTRAVYADLIGFNLLTFFDTLNYVLFMQSPVFVLQDVVGLRIAGQYGIGLQLNNLVRGFLTALMNAIYPLAISLEAQGNTNQLTDVFRMSTKVFLAVAATIWVCTFFLGAIFFALWLKRDVSELVFAFPWVMATSSIGIATMPSAVLVVALQRMRIPAASGVLLAAAMIGTLLAMRLTGYAHPLIVASVILCVFFTAYQLARFLVVVVTLRMRVLDIAEMCARAVLPAAVTTPLLWLCMRYWPVTTWWQLCLVGGAVLVLNGGLGVLAVLTPRERAVVSRMQHRAEPVLS